MRPLGLVLDSWLRPQRSAEIEISPIHARNFTSALAAQKKNEHSVTLHGRPTPDREELISCLKQSPNFIRCWRSCARWRHGWSCEIGGHHRREVASSVGPGQKPRDRAEDIAPALHRSCREDSFNLGAVEIGDRAVAMTLGEPSQISRASRSRWSPLLAGRSGSCRGAPSPPRRCRPRLIRSCDQPAPASPHRAFAPAPAPRC